ncbi:MAG: hypothetical protein AB7I30_00520 [Isosphaeraceae bacterium]
MHAAPPLDVSQREQADRIDEALMKAAAIDLRVLADLLASRPDEKLLGKTAFQVRDAVHDLGALALQAALDERKKGGTRVPA